MRRRLFDAGTAGPGASLGLLAVRLTVGILLPYLHGWKKLLSFGEKAATFADPLGIGHNLSMAGAIGGEVVFPILVAAGLATRFSSIPPAFTMAVAAFLVQAGEPLKEKELAILYLAPFVLLFFTGAGRYSLDAVLGGGKKAPKRPR